MTDLDLELLALEALVELLHRAGVDDDPDRSLGEMIAGLPPRGRRLATELLETFRAGC